VSKTFKKIYANTLQQDVGQLNLLGNTVTGFHNESRNKVPVSKGRDQIKVGLQAE
jgi:hypothetical protein